MAPHVASPVTAQSVAQASDAATVAATAVTDCTTISDGAGKLIAAKITSSETAATTIAAVTGKCAAGQFGSTENNGNCKNSRDFM
jgi:hypothetical protein